MTRRSDEALVYDILGAADMLNLYLHGQTRRRFDENPMLKDASVRQLSVIGEAVYQMSDAFKDEHAGIPWSAIEGLRHIVVHSYWTIDYNIVWNTARRDVSDLAKYLRRVS